MTKPEAGAWLPSTTTGRTDVTEPIFTPEAIAAAEEKVQRYCSELDITNADHIALWLETNTEEPRISWLAVQIVEAFDRVINRNHNYWGAGEPDCPREIKASNGEIWKLRCKVCGQDDPRFPICIPGEPT